MIYGGIDYSLNCPCLCIYDDSLGEFSHDTCEYYFQQHSVSEKEKERRLELKLKNIHPSVQYEWKDDHHRFFGLADYFLSILIQYGVSIVAMENYSLGSTGKVFNIAECTAALKQFMMLTALGPSKVACACCSPLGIVSDQGLVLVKVILVTLSL